MDQAGQYNVVVVFYIKANSVDPGQAASKGSVCVTMYNVRNNRISDGCVYAQIRKGLGMHLVTYANRDTVPFLLIVQ